MTSVIGKRASKQTHSGVRRYLSNWDGDGVINAFLPVSLSWS